MKKGIIVASFGTTYEDARRLCIESIENRVKEKYKDCLVLRSFTSQMVINKLRKRDNYIVNNTLEALEKMKANGIKEIYIQPLHIVAGFEYEKLIGQVDEFLKDNRDYKVKIGKPLLYTDEDYKKVAEALILPDIADDESIVFMGHGTQHSADISYNKLENTFKEKGSKNVFIGTVEGDKAIENIVLELKSMTIEKVRLMPFMLVTGDHAVNDMASDKEDSWKNILEKEGFYVEPILKGLGEIKGIQDIYIEHLENIMD